jgi:hypothetical protein
MTECMGEARVVVIDNHRRLPWLRDTLFAVRYTLKLEKHVSCEVKLKLKKQLSIMYTVQRSTAICKHSDK